MGAVKIGEKMFIDAKISFKAKPKIIEEIQEFLDFKKLPKEYIFLAEELYEMGLEKDDIKYMIKREINKIEN